MCRRTIVTYTATIVFDSPLFDPSLDQLQTLRVRVIRPPSDVHLRLDYAAA